MIFHHTEGACMSNTSMHSSASSCSSPPQGVECPAGDAPSIISGCMTSSFPSLCPKAGSSISSSRGGDTCKHWPGGDHQHPTGYCYAPPPSLTLQSLHAKVFHPSRANIFSNWVNWDDGDRCSKLMSNAAKWTSMIPAIVVTALR